MNEQEFRKWMELLEQHCAECLSDVNLHPKHHTIRTGEGWEVGKPIHFIINNRTKARYQFAPIINVKKVDEVVMTFDTGFDIQVNGSWLDASDIGRMAMNDGFSSVDDMAEWFFPNAKVDSVKGVMIHWTDLVNY